jgi:hypothetical protein
MSGRHFRARTFFDVTRRGRVRPHATDLTTCSRHGDPAQTATLPCRSMSLYLDASVYADLRLSGDSKTDPLRTCTDPHSYHAFVLSVLAAFF